MKFKILENKEEYHSALCEIDGLIALDPGPSSDKGRHLALLSLIVEDYERKRYRFDQSDPIDVLRFIIEQQGIEPKDLVPLLGSRSKASELLSRKRPLTLSMIRSLHRGLGIPADVLLRDSVSAEEEPSSIHWERFPIREMIKRRWIDIDIKTAKINAQLIIESFLKPIGGIQASPVLCRKTRHVRAVRDFDYYALEAWRAQVLRRATSFKALEFHKNHMSMEVLGEVARLSKSQKGPLLACDVLKSYGIIVIVEPHLPKTYLDGAAFLSPSGTPVIGLTLRHDRIDNFWFVLMHELVHVWKHLSDSMEAIVDDLDANNIGEEMEDEADLMAQEALIPSKEWDNSAARHLGTVDGAVELAYKLRIHPAIVAGRIRQEHRNYRKLSHMLGHGEMSVLFNH